MSYSHWGGRILPDGLDNDVAVILTAVIWTHKDIAQFNLNTKRFTSNPFPFCRKAILTMQLPPHLPGFKVNLMDIIFLQRYTMYIYTGIEKGNI